MVQFDVKRVQKGTESFMVSFDFTKTPITQVADYIIIAASKHKASDIHFDPREDGMMVRFRIDGDCQDYTFVPKAYEKNLTTRLKLLANMNITESRLPQDGAIKGEFGGTYLDMRVSSLPLNEGEKVVIRILDYTRSMQGIESLGFHPDNLKKVKRMMEIPNGIILTTGATGSGKSTTTYSILQELNKPEKNIITVEDPIEMNIEGINQVQVNSEIGMTFAAALRSILRQDPNIILIGEIRDSETAQIAVRASITGHLVLSTIHTNNALATVERLLDMNVERYLLSTALTGIISQRLAKMLCPYCRFKRETTPYEKKIFKKFMHMDVPMIWDANSKGCEHCRKGYHGRIAFHEVLELDDDIRAALNNPKIDKKELSKMVYTDKTITMLQDALIKCYNGQTSFEEVYRNIEIETEEEEDDAYETEISDFMKKIIPKNAEISLDNDIESDGLIDTNINKNDKNNISNIMKNATYKSGNVNTTPVVKNNNPVNINTSKENNNSVSSYKSVLMNNTVNNYSTISAQTNSIVTPENKTIQPLKPDIFPNNEVVNNKQTSTESIHNISTTPLKPISNINIQQNHTDSNNKSVNNKQTSTNTIHSIHATPLKPISNINIQQNYTDSNNKSIDNKQTSTNTIHSIHATPLKPTDNKNVSQQNHINPSSNVVNNKQMSTESIHNIPTTPLKPISNINIQQNHTDSNNKSIDNKQMSTGVVQIIPNDQLKSVNNTNMTQHNHTDSNNNVITNKQINSGVVKIIPNDQSKVYNNRNINQQNHSDRNTNKQINKTINSVSTPPIYRPANTIQNYYSNTGYSYSPGQVSPISPTISIPSKNNNDKK